jgi:hypothetical protein
MMTPARIVNERKGYQTCSSRGKLVGDVKKNQKKKVDSDHAVYHRIGVTAFIAYPQRTVPDGLILIYARGSALPPRTEVSRGDSFIFDCC